MNWRKVLIGCSIAAGVSLLLLISVGYFSIRRIIKNRPRRVEVPSALKNPSVLTGSNFLSKSLFFEDARLGSITDIVAGEFDPVPGTEIGIAGENGAAFLGENIAAKSTVLFSERASHVDIIDTNADGVCEFLNRGSWGIDASLIDHEGNTIWTCGGLPGVDDMAAGDIDGDGAMDFVAGFNGGGGVRRLDENGEKLWRQRDGNVWHVELVDTDGDGHHEIVHSNAGGQIMVRDGEGEIINQARRPPVYFSHFSLCRWPNKADREYALLSSDSTIWLFDFDGQVAARFTAPHCGRLGHARGTPVRIRSDHPEYLAVIVAFRHWNRSILYVYDSARTLVYQEVLPEGCASIAALSLDESEPETLLIGGDGRVWQYTAGKASEAG